jgi:hypothetical protein
MFPGLHINIMFCSTGAPWRVTCCSLGEFPVRVGSQQPSSLRCSRTSRDQPRSHRNLKSKGLSLRVFPNLRRAQTLQEPEALRCSRTSGEPKPCRNLKPSDVPEPQESHLCRNLKPSDVLEPQESHLVQELPPRRRLSFYGNSGPNV